MPYANNGDCRIYYETFGDPADPAILLVNGLGSQSINYTDDWCRMFVARHLFVIRYDNRDVGLSSDFADAPSISPIGNKYEMGDMAADGIAVLDALGIERAHVMGASMGGMITQFMAINHPDRLLSATSVMTRTGEPGYGDATPEAFALITAPAPTTREEYVQQWIDGLRCWGSPEFADEARWRADAERFSARAFRPDGTARQALAVRAAQPRADDLRKVRLPFLVLHGTADTLIPQSGGERTAELVPGARLVLIEGMGHDYPPQLWQRWTDEVTGFIESLPATS